MAERAEAIIVPERVQPGRSRLGEFLKGDWYLYRDARPKSFVEKVLWSEFQELNAALIAYLSEITEKVIREEVHGETADADEIAEPVRIGR